MGVTSLLGGDGCDITLGWGWVGLYPWVGMSGTSLLGGDQ